ncbi:lanthionine synthetase C family protein [Geodermatophilus sp. SYSU D00814]
MTPDDTAREIGLRLARDEVLAAAIESFRVHTTFGESVHWRAPSVAQGHAGLAVLFGALDTAFPTDGWDRIGHRHLTWASRAFERGPSHDASLFTGAAGLGFAALTLAGGRTRYRRFLAAVDAQVTKATQDACEWLDACAECPVGAFDLISGVTGMGAYLLARDAPEADAALDVILRTLVRLVLSAPDAPPRWHTPFDWLGSAEQQEAYPHGNLNCGLAHGIPGPLALLSLALSHGHEPPEARDAVDRAVRWLAAHRIQDAWGTTWPAAVPLAPDGTPAGTEEPARAGWCYGAPGVARALWHAGTALGDRHIRASAVEAMTAALARPPEHRALHSPNYCHGVAGLLHITTRFAEDTGLPAFRQAQADLLAELMTAYEPGSLLGFRNVEPGDVRVEHPGVLDGAPGVALSLLAAAGPAPATWDRLFLLA